MPKLCLPILQILYVSVIFLACGQDSSNRNKEYSEIKFDTSKTAILQLKQSLPRGKEYSELTFDTTKTAILQLKQSLPRGFDSTYKSGKLTQNDLYIIDSLLVKSVADFNDWQVKNNSRNSWKINLKSQNYKKQIVVVTNNRGEKEVWVNCFCEDLQNDWKSNLVYVEDGATCFFNFKINLVTKTYYDFFVNSAA